MHLRLGHQATKFLHCADSVKILLVKHEVKAVNQSVVDVSLKARHVRQNLSAGNDVVRQCFDVHSIRFVLNVRLRLSLQTSAFASACNWCGLDACLVIKTNLAEQLNSVRVHGDIGDKLVRKKDLVWLLQDGVTQVRRQQPTCGGSVLADRGVSDSLHLNGSRLATKTSGFDVLIGFGLRELSSYGLDTSRATRANALTSGFKLIDALLHL